MIRDTTPIARGATVIFTETGADAVDRPRRGKERPSRGIVTGGPFLLPYSPGEWFNVFWHYADGGIGQTCVPRYQLIVDPTFT